MKLEVTMESSVFHDLHVYLERHESLIASDDFGFGELRSVFIAFFNRAPEAVVRGTGVTFEEHLKNHQPQEIHDGST